jgi:LmbE family N-acetylglucosaminyl deacetylase
MTDAGGAAVLCALLATAALAADGVLVVAPHPDDEVVMAGGILATAAAAGREAAVVVVTNGDYFGTDYGLVREGETVDALGMLGIAEGEVVFLGYPDSGLLALWNDAPDDSERYLSPWSGRDTTYATRGRDHADLHRAVTGIPGLYNQPTLVADVRDALALFHPADVFTTGPVDGNPDHRATYYAVRDALKGLALADPTYHPTLHTTVVHDPKGYPFDDFWPASAPRDTPFVPGNDDLWPNPPASSGVPHRFDPEVDFVAPPSLAGTVVDWESRVEWPVPTAMALSDFAANLKVRSLARYGTQQADILWSHVKRDEFFWAERVLSGRFSANIAPAATASAVSAAPGQGAAAAIDGVVDGAPGDPAAEWVADGPGPGAALRLAWGAPVSLDRIIVFDRVSLSDRVLASRLVLDDGTELRLGPLANDGRGDEVVLPEVHRASALTFLVEAALGNAGLAEIQVFGALPATPCSDDAVCDDGNRCARHVCRAGTCADDPVPDDTRCGDGDACNGIEVCESGACVRHPAPSCDDGDPCTRDGCLPGRGCFHEDACHPRMARGPGGCRLGVVGIPDGACEDGDPTCDRDQAIDGACSFDVILCANVRRGACLRGALARVRAQGPGAVGVADLVVRLGARLPTQSRACVGPVRLRVPPGRVRVPFVVTTVRGRRTPARLVLRCAAAPWGIARRPPAPAGP